jgi:hypothetical protein
VLKHVVNEIMKRFVCLTLSPPFLFLNMTPMHSSGVEITRPVIMSDGTL